MINPKLLRQFPFLMALVALLSVACAREANEAAISTPSVLVPTVATNMPVDQIELEPSSTAVSSSVSDETSPTTTPAISDLELPLIMNRGAPANDRCVVNNPHPSEDAVNVYAAPDLQSALVAQLGNWADVLQTDIAWYKILIPQGGVGWVQAEKVVLSGVCSSE